MSYGMLVGENDSQLVTSSPRAKPTCVAGNQRADSIHYPLDVPPNSRNGLYLLLDVTRLATGLTGP